MTREPDGLFTAWDTTTNNTVIALSNCVQNCDKREILSGRLLRVVSIKNAAQKSFSRLPMRLLVQESHSIFCRTQQEAKTNSLSVPNIISYSLQYRSVIRSARLSLQDEDADLKEILCLYDLIWSLFEAIFMKTHDSSIVLDLMSWARLCLARNDFVSEVSDNLRASRINQLDLDMFWRQIIYFVFSGLFNNAIKFLEAYKNIVDDTAVIRLIDVLAALDIDLLCDESTAMDFVSYQKEVHDLCATGVFKTNANAERIALLIAGDQETFKSLSEFFNNWFEIVPLYLLLLRPCATVLQLIDVAKECVTMFNCDVKKGIDAVMYELFSLDAVRALYHLTLSSSDWWLAAHLSDLLQKTDERTTNVYGVDIRQHLLIEYATALFCESGLWRIGFDYLRECGNEGLLKLELLLSKVPIENETVAIKLSAFCCQAGLNHLSTDIAQFLSLRLLRQKQWNTALSWAFRSQDPRLISSVADKILFACTPSEISKISVVEKINDVILLTPSLIFLHDYYKFRSLLEKGEKKQGIENLVELVTSDFVPKKFEDVMFTDLMTILNLDNGSALSRDGTLRILRHLTLYEFDKDPAIDPEQREMRFRTLRYMLLRNLADAIVF